MFSVFTEHASSVQEKHISGKNLVVVRKAEYQKHNLVVLNGHFWEYIEEILTKTRAAKTNVCRNLAVA